jgi:hypothetical protein
MMQTLDTSAMDHFPARAHKDRKTPRGGGRPSRTAACAAPSLSTLKLTVPAVPIKLSTVPVHFDSELSLESNSSDLSDSDEGHSRSIIARCFDPRNFIPRDCGMMVDIMHVLKVIHESRATHMEGFHELTVKQFQELLEFAQSMANEDGQVDCWNCWAKMLGWIDFRLSRSSSQIFSVHTVPTGSMSAWKAIAFAEKTILHSMLAAMPVRASPNARKSRLSADVLTPSHQHSSVQAQELSRKIESLASEIQDRDTMINSLQKQIQDSQARISESEDCRLFEARHFQTLIHSLQSKLGNATYRLQCLQRRQQENGFRTLSRTESLDPDPALTPQIEKFCRELFTKHVLSSGECQRCDLMQALARKRVQPHTSEELKKFSEKLMATLHKTAQSTYELDELLVLAATSAANRL